LPSSVWPSCAAFGPVNKDIASPSAEGLTLQTRLGILVDNFKTVVSLRTFWLAALHVMLFNGPWYNLNGMWIAPSLRTSSGTRTRRRGRGNVAGLIIGGLVFPALSTLLRTREWVLFVTTLSAFAVILTCAVVDQMTAVVFSLMREYYGTRSLELRLAAGTG
jgi:hypothetical protein